MVGSFDTAVLVSLQSQSLSLFFPGRNVFDRKELTECFKIDSTDCSTFKGHNCALAETVW
jgi:hypothetical protein